LGEIVGFEATSTLEPDDRIDISGDHETDDEGWDWELTSLVAANADILVRVSWMGGAEMTLGAAMWTFPPITRENVHQVIAEVYQLLANRVIESEELEETDESEEEKVESNEEKLIKKPEKRESTEKSQTKTKIPKEPISSSTEDAKKLSPKIIVAAKRLEPIHEAEKSAGSMVDESDKPNTPTPPAAKDALNKNILAAKTLMEPARLTLAFEVPETEIAPDPVFESRATSDESKIVTAQQAENLTAPVAAEMAAEPESIEPLPLDLNDLAIAVEPAELADEVIELVEDQPALPALDFPIGMDSLADFVEMEAAFDHLEESVVEPEEQLFDVPTLEVFEADLEVADAVPAPELDVSNLPSRVGITSSEEEVQVSLTAEEIEDSLTELIERIEASKPETIEMANEVLDKIVAVPLQLEAARDEDIVSEAEAQKELEELFSELLENMDVDCTPELVEALAYLTLKWRLDDQIDRLKSEIEIDERPMGGGTHEIKQLQAGLSNLKKLAALAEAIGWSAVQLYSFNFGSQFFGRAREATPRTMARPSFFSFIWFIFSKAP